MHTTRASSDLIKKKRFIDLSYFWMFGAHHIDVAVHGLGWSSRHPRFYYCQKGLQLPGWGGEPCQCLALREPLCEPSVPPCRIATAGRHNLSTERVHFSFARARAAPYAATPTRAPHCASCDPFEALRPLSFTGPGVQPAPSALAPHAATSTPHRATAG